MKVSVDYLELVLARIKDLETLEAQTAALELLVIEAELNPNPEAFYELRTAVRILSEILSRDDRDWLATDRDLKPFFAA